MAVGQRRGGVVDAVRFDLRRLHETWMELVFPRQLGAAETVLGKWTPDTVPGRGAYWLWGLLGAFVVALLYPVTLLGFATRFYAVKLDGTATRLGIAGVVGLSAVVWGGLTVLARIQFSQQGFYAVGAASLVATLAAALAVVFGRVGGRKTSVLLAYPCAVTTLFLPPVVAALYSPTLASVVFPKSTSLARWALDNPLAVAGLNDYLRAQYDLSGVAYVGMWFAIAVPAGWLFGLLVTLANLIRPE